MRVVISKSHKQSYTEIAQLVNKNAKNFSQGRYKVSPKVDKLVKRKDITPLRKKKMLSTELKKHIINAFSIDIDKIKDKKNFLKKLKKNLNEIRKIIIKLKDINYYIKESLLNELGIINKSLKIFKSKNPEALAEKARFVFNKKYYEKLEHTTYKLIEKIIIFDNKMLEDIKEKEENIEKKEKIEIKDLKNILSKESEILNHLEAKIPPEKSVSGKLLQKKIFNTWTPRVLSLMTGYLTELKREDIINKKLSRSKKIKKILNKKISSLENEKKNLINIKQKRIFDMSRNVKQEDELRMILHDFAALQRV